MSSVFLYSINQCNGFSCDFGLDLKDTRYFRIEMSVLGGWNLVYREPDEVENILAESGYEGIEVWLEPEKVFCIGKGEKSG